MFYKNSEFPSNDVAQIDTYQAKRCVQTTSWQHNPELCTNPGTFSRVGPVTIAA